MQPAIVEARPPYVSFERVAVEDRAATETSGRYTTKNQDWAYVTPQGSKDRIPRIVSEWFDNLKQQVREGRFPEAWLVAYQASYERWASNQEIPENGTPILQWPLASPAMVKNLLTWNIRTVEDLAVANEETIGRLGMGARDLKQKAVAWIQEAAGTGQAATRAAALGAENDALRARNAALEALVEELRVDNEALHASLGRQPVEAAAPGISVDNLLGDEASQQGGAPAGMRRL